MADIFTVAGSIPVAVAATSELTRAGSYTGRRGRYELFTHNGNPVVTAEGWRLFPARLPSRQMGLMKIAAATDFNQELLNEAEVIGRFQAIAKQIDEKAGRTHTAPYNYGAFFPTLLETMTAGDGRQAMFLGFDPSIASYKQLIPVATLTRTKRVDLKTGTWIGSKLYKVVDFAHRLARYTVGAVNASNVFLETEQHGTIILNLFDSRSDPSTEDQSAEVQAVAKLVWDACGGSANQNPPPDSGIMSAEDHDSFVAFLRGAMESEAAANEMQGTLHDLADQIWPKVKTASGTGKKRQWHPWVTYPRA